MPPTRHRPGSSATGFVHRPPRRLGRYPGEGGRIREVVCRDGHAGSLLVIDRDAATGGEPRLVAHLGADEPPRNAVLVWEHYLRAGRSRTCRALTAEDWLRAPFAEPRRTGSPDSPRAHRRSAHGFSLLPLPGEMSIPELRWTRATPGPEAEERDSGVGEWGVGEPEPGAGPRAAAGGPRAVSLRSAVGELESYEPLCSLTRCALAAHRDDAGISTVALAAELERVLLSPIVLNRRLREVVLERVRRGELSMSEIARRCGRVKRDRGGNVSGETSWLARRIGLLAEGGNGAPTRWIHTDVLALIAREGLALAPREVELG